MGWKEQGTMKGIRCSKCGYEPWMEEFIVVADQLNQTLAATIIDFVVNGCFALDTGILHFSAN